MKKKLTALALTLLGSLNLISCDYYDGRLYIINKTDKTIVFEYDNDTILEVPSINKKEYFLREKIAPGDNNNLVLPGSTQAWPWYVAEKSDSTLRIYVYDYTLVLNNDWDSLRVNKLYEKRLDFTLDKLNQLNWEVEIK